MGKITGWLKIAGNWILDNPKNFGRLLWMGVGIMIFVMVVGAWTVDATEKKYVGIVGPVRVVAGADHKTIKAQIVYKDCSDLNKSKYDAVILGVYDSSGGIFNSSVSGPKVNEGDRVEMTEWRYYSKTNPPELIRTYITARLIKAGYCPKFGLPQVF